MAVPNQTTMEAWEKEKEKKKKKEKKSKVSDEQKFEDANGDIKGEISSFLAAFPICILTIGWLDALVKIEDEGSAMEGVVSTSEQTSSEQMDVDGVTESDDVSQSYHNYWTYIWI